MVHIQQLLVAKSVTITGVGTELVDGTNYVTHPAVVDSVGQIVVTKVH